MSDLKSVTVSLNSRNYPTCKIQCRMVLIRDGLWSIVNGTEIAPDETAKLREHLLREEIKPSLHCTLSRPIIAVFTWQSRRPKNSRDQASRTISKKDMGKQAATEEKSLFITQQFLSEEFSVLASVIINRPLRTMRPLCFSAISLRIAMAG